MYVLFIVVENTYDQINETKKITHSHGSGSVLKATKQVDGKGQNSTPRHTKTP